MDAARPARRAQPAQRRSSPGPASRPWACPRPDDETALAAAAAGFAGAREPAASHRRPSTGSTSSTTACPPTCCRRWRRWRPSPAAASRSSPAASTAASTTGRWRPGWPPATRPTLVLTVPDNGPADPGRDRGGGPGQVEVPRCGDLAEAVGRGYRWARPGRGRAALAGRAELRPVPRLPGPRRGVRPRHARLHGLTSARLPSAFSSSARSSPARSSPAPSSPAPAFSPTAPSALSPQPRVEEVTTGRPWPMKKMPGKPAVSKPRLGSSGQRGVRDGRVPVRSLLTKKIAPPPSGASCPAMTVSRDRHGEAVAVEVDRPAAAAAGGAGPGRVGAAADGPVAGE